MSKAMDDKQEWTPEYIAKLVGGYANINETARIILSDHINAALAAARREEIATCRAISHDHICKLEEQLAAVNNELTRWRGLYQERDDQLAAECQRREQAERSVTEWKRAHKAVAEVADGAITRRQEAEQNAELAHIAASDRKKELLSALVAIEKALKCEDDSPSLHILRTIDLSALKESRK